MLFKLKAKTDAEYKEATESIAALLKVPGPISMHVGPPEIDARAKGFNYGLYSVFEDRAALDKYAPSKEHVDTVANNVRPYIEGTPTAQNHTLTSDILAYDWEISEKTGY